MNREQIDWSLPRRQSWAALFIILYKILLRFIKMFWPFLLWYLFRNKRGQFDTFELMIIGLSALSLVGSVVEFLYFRFYIQDDDLIIKSGFITKKTISLPLHKIQAVHIEQTWLHSLLNAARLSFDSAGSEKIEVKIDAINKPEAEAFKRFILDTRQLSDETTGQIIPKPEKVLIQLSGRDLFKLSISANHLEAFLLMIAFFFSAFEQVKDIFNLEYTRFVRWAYKYESSSVTIVLFSVIAFLLVSVVISTVRVLFRYFSFRISESERGFTIHSGLVNIQEKLVPFRKIQYISWKANWIRQRMRLFILQFHAIGAADMSEKLRIKVPVTRPDMIPVLLEQYHPLLNKDHLHALHIHPAFIVRRFLIAGLLPVAVLFIPGFIFFKWTALWLTGWLVLISVSAFLFRKKFRMWADTDALQIRRGVLGIEKIILRWDMIQSVSLEQSIYQEGRDLATISLYTAAGIITVPFIPLQDARDIMNFALYRIEREQHLPRLSHLPVVQ
jgi:putative membrane protein